MWCPHVRCVSKMIDMIVKFGPTCLLDQLKSATVASTPAEVIRTSQSLSMSMSEVSAVFVHLEKQKRKIRLTSPFLFCLYWFVSRLPAAQGYLSVQLDDSKTFSAENAYGSCLEAKVSYSPVIRRCVWETPNNTLVKCTLQNWVTNNNRYRCMTRCRQRLMSAICIFFLTNSLWTLFFFWCRTVKFCNPIKSGDYKLHLEAGERKETKTISVCVVGEQICFVLFLSHK